MWNRVKTTFRGEKPFGQIVLSIVRDEIRSVRGPRLSLDAIDSLVRRSLGRKSYVAARWRPREDEWPCPTSSSRINIYLY